jgi:hypothetical protein
MQLLSAHNVTDPSVPGIYVVAVSTRSFQAPAANVAAASNPISAADQVGIINEHGPGTPKNASSIACMIMWPPDGETSHTPVISHFFAGDLWWSTEQDLYLWTGLKGDRTNNDGWIPTIKLSHHGSKSSTPWPMLNAYNPRHMIASVCEGNGHPSEYK